MARREVAEEAVEACLAESLPEVDLREVTIVGSARDPMLRVVIDHPDGVDHDLCVRVTHELEQVGLRDEHGIEVSSPGPEPPLRTPRHFRDAVGAQVRIRVSDAKSSRGWRERTGELLGVDDDGLTLGLDEGVLQIKLADVRRAHEIK
jgi:ribosome maturation factor RimP